MEASGEGHRAPWLRSLTGPTPRRALRRSRRQHLGHIAPDPVHSRAFAMTNRVPRADEVTFSATDASTSMPHTARLPRLAVAAQAFPLAYRRLGPKTG